MLAEGIKKLVSQELRYSPDELRISIRPPLKNQSNKLYDIWYDDRHWIVKEFLQENEKAWASQHEYQALRRLEALDVAPRPLCLVQFQENPVVVYEYMTGQMWDRHRPSSNDRLALLETWKRVHSIGCADLWLSKGAARTVSEIIQGVDRHLRHYMDWASTYFKPGVRGAKISLKILEKRSSLLDESVKQRAIFRFCKSDPRFANVIQRPDGRIGLVDWEDSGRRDPAREFVDLVTHPNQEDLFSWEDWVNFFNDYAMYLLEEDRYIKERVHLYMGIFPLFWLGILTSVGVERSFKGKTAGWSVNQLPVNLRLRRYLARAAAWPGYDFSQEIEDYSDILFFPENGGNRDSIT